MHFGGVKLWSWETTLVDLSIELSVHDVLDEMPHLLIKYDVTMDRSLSESFSLKIKTSPTYW
jgi:hypothetical protein